MGSVRRILAHGSGIDDLLLTGIATFGFLLYSMFRAGRGEPEDGEGRVRCAYCGARRHDGGRCGECGFRLRRGPAARR
jgi:hypothetical protein